MRVRFVVPTQFRSVTALACGVAFFFVSQGNAASAGQQAAVPPPPTIQLEPIYSGFVGDWVGQLEYRDYSSNARVALPAWLRVSKTADGRSLQFAYLYDDGPGKTVKELSVVSIDAAAATMSFKSEGVDRDHSSDNYTVAGLPDFASKGQGTLTLAGTGVENGKKVDVRITISLHRNLYKYQKETRLAGEEYQFRDAYTFTRKQAPE